MDLIDRYLVAVRRQLATGLQAADIIQELGDSLRSEAEEQERQLGRPLTADEQAALLKKRGHPWLMANRYLPQQHLIGPVLYPYYRQALRIAVFWVVLPIVLIGGAIHAIYSPDASRAWGHALGGAWNGAIYAVGIVTIVFALVEHGHVYVRVRSNFFERWDPARLREPGQGRSVPRSESVVGLVITLTLLIWWTTSQPAFTVYAGDGVRFVGGPIWQELHLGILISLAAAAALNLVDLVRPWRTAAVSACDIAISLFSLFLITRLVRAGQYVEMLGASGDAARLELASEWINRITGWSLMIVGAAISFHVLSEVWRLVKSRRVGPTALVVTLLLTTVAVAGCNDAGSSLPNASSIMVAPPLDAATARRFAALALACVQKEYPNKIAHVLNSAADVKSPRALTPAFYGCYDWHSAVHGHWLLARVARAFPGTPFAHDAMNALATNITPAHVEGEVAYLSAPGRETFERPYGLAWLLQLAGELKEWDAPEAKALSAALGPLETAAADRLQTWLEKLAYPIREGEHAQTAFAFGLALDWARTNRPALAALLERRTREYHLKDRVCPIDYEPSGQDFLSPCLAEADLMRRVLPPAEFASWLTGFLPRLPTDASPGWLPVGVVTDKTDGKLAHLDGLNLSRAWMLDGIASGLPATDARRLSLLAAAKTHAESGLSAVTGEHYVGGHWLGSFATYLVTARGKAGTPR